MNTATGWCVHGRHDRCSHRVGGPCQGGITLTRGGRYSCPCECHRDNPAKPFQADVTQLGLFEVAR